MHWLTESFRQALFLVLAVGYGLRLGALLEAARLEAALLEAARSRVPALGYGVAYALGNVILALGASLVVRFISCEVHQL